MMTMLLLSALQTPPDEAACLAFARKLESSIAGGDGSEVDRMIDREALMDRAFKDTPGKDKDRASFRAGIVKTFKLGPAVSKAVREGDGSFTFLRLRTVGGERRALFRMIADGSFNYHDYLLEAGPGGTVRATDLHVMLSGEWMSETFRRAWLGFVAGQPGLLGRLTGRENEYLQTASAIESMSRLKREGKAAEALKVFDALPAEAKKDKMVLLSRYQAAQDAAPELLPKVLDEFEKAHPGDACLPAISIDAHLVAKRHDRALAALDVVDRSIGGDPYLHVMRAAVHMETGAMDRAKTAAAKALEQDKRLPEAYWTMVTISLREKNHVDTAKWLKAVELDLAIELADLSQIEEYADFVKSPEYRAWQKSRNR